METVLASHLLALSDEFRRSRDLGEATVGKHCAADGRFFSRIREGKTFTAKKYDEVVAWFSRNWPDDADWPTEIHRPSQSVIAAEAAE